MKLNFTLMGLVAFIAICPPAMARINAPAPDNSQTAAATPAATTPVAATPAAAETVVATNATVVVATPATNATPDAAVVAAAPAVVVAAPAAPADASVSHDPGAVIPLIVMDEVPLTDAIKNLARQANLNYMLDPKINYGAVDANGQMHQQPTVSLRWENLTADQALNAVLNNYNMTIIDDTKTHIARITIKDPAAPEPLVTKIIQLKYGDASNMVANIQTVLQDKRSKALSDSRTSQVVLVATEKEIVEVDQLVARLDTQTKEVLIEAKLVELTKNPTTAKGIDWTSTVGAQNFSFGNNQYVPGAGVSTNNLIPLSPTPRLLVDTAKGFNPATAFLNADGVSAVLSFLNTDADAKVLSTPRTVTLDNQEAILEVTEAEPIIQTTAGTQGSPGGSQITYTNLGTILHVTPRISANSTINLKVVPEVSSFEKTVSKIVSGLRTDADVFAVRRLETHVLIPSGNTLVMGGLVSDASTQGNTKVPVLGDIPWLGAAFRSDTKTQNKRNLIIFITPTIVQNEDFQPTKTDFLKTKMDDKPTADFGAWDSGKPQDWSKLTGSKNDQTAETSDHDIWATK